MQETLHWYRRAAEQPSSNWSGFDSADTAAPSNDEGSGDQELAEAQTRLGLLLFQGRGVPLDYDEASKWFHQAADKGNLCSQSFLGAMYVDGLGVSQDFVKAAKLFKVAAEKGFAVAQYHLGELLDAQAFRVAFDHFANGLAEPVAAPRRRLVGG